MEDCHLTSQNKVYVYTHDNSCVTSFYHSSAYLLYSQKDS